MAISRDESFRIQALQLTDALLVWIAFWIGWELRSFVLDTNDTAKETINWVLYIAVPFTPLVLSTTTRLRPASATARSTLRVPLMCTR